MDDYSNERILWRSVVQQSIDDVFSDNYWNQREAIRWIFKKNEDFDLVCDFAGVSPQYVRVKALEQIINGR